MTQLEKQPIHWRARTTARWEGASREQLHQAGDLGLPEILSTSGPQHGAHEPEKGGAVCKRDPSHSGFWLFGFGIAPGRVPAAGHQAWIR